ncbi:cereblon family protein [Pacificispira sp.]|uniref:cereblon family protein n=1 Tax=Pacificispira sp. TaxID=2888761 RepID=UPI003B520221
MLDELTAGKPDSDVERTEDDQLFCAGCGASVTRESLAVVRRDSHEHTVFNPMGQVFTIRCFGEAWSLLSPWAGRGDFTWFPGYQWRVAVCGACGRHIGWRYDLQSGSDRFYGLIRSALSGRKPG